MIDFNKIPEEVKDKILELRLLGLKQKDIAEELNKLGYKKYTGNFYLQRDISGILIHLGKRSVTEHTKNMKQNNEKEINNENNNTTNLMFFSFENLDIRTLTKKDGSIWFVGLDVCKVLDIQDSSQAISRLEKDDTCIIGVTDSLGRNQNTLIINESGLYNLIFTSRKPEAKQFKYWVTSKVLPELRKTGSYSLNVPKTLPEALRLYADQCEATAAAEQREKQAIQEKQLVENQFNDFKKDTDLKIEKANKTISVLKITAEAYKNFVNQSPNEIYTIDQIVAMFGSGKVGKNNLLKYMRTKGILRDESYETFDSKGNKIIRFGKNHNVPYTKNNYHLFLPIRISTDNSNHTSNVVHVNRKGIPFILKVIDSYITECMSNLPLFKEMKRENLVLENIEVFGG